MTLTQSDLGTLARCRRKFYYRNIAGLPEGKASKAMSEGTILHGGLAGAFRYIQSCQPKEETDWHWSLPTSRDAGLEAMEQMLRAGEYEYRGTPQKLAVSIEDSDTVNRLGDVFQYYCEHQLGADMKDAIVVAVEQNYRIEIGKLLPALASSSKVRSTSFCSASSNSRASSKRGTTRASRTSNCKWRSSDSIRKC